MYKLSSYIIDDIDVVCNLPVQVENDAQLVTKAVVNLYSNIPYKFGVDGTQYTKVLLWLVKPLHVF